MSEAPAGTRLWLYRRSFTVGLQDCLVLVDSRTAGVFSTLSIDGEPVASDFTPPTGPAAVRNHLLSGPLGDGRQLVVEAGYINWLNIGIAARADGGLIHESHPGHRIAFPERAARMVARQSPEGRPAYDLGKLKRNRVPILVDIATGLLFFAVAKLTDLRTAALVGAGVGLALVVLQRFIKTDILGGLALFGIVMLMISAGFAIAFEDDEIIKQRSTIVGLIGATLFLLDALLLGGKRLGAGIGRYIVYGDLDDRRLAIGMGLTAAAMAMANYVMVKQVSTDVWLFYTTFADVPLTVALVLLAIHWARVGSEPAVPAAG